GRGLVACWGAAVFRSESRIRRTSSPTSRTLSPSIVAAYTLLQLFEVAIATTILFIGVLNNWVPVALLGGGFLIGKAILNILWPEGGSVYRRSVIGYGIAAVFVLGGVIFAHFAA